MTLRDRVLGVVPAIAARAREAEQLRRVPGESIAALRDAGVFRVFTPARYGGSELAPGEVYAALIEIARACPATGWVASLLAIHGFLLARFDPRAQDEIWAGGPDALAASGVAPAGTGTRVAGGVRVTGRWSYASGVDHCAWAILNARIGDESHFVIVPIADCTIDDDWHVAGLRGSGSKTVVLDDVLVPSHRVEPGVALYAGKTTGLASQSALFHIWFSGLWPLTFAPAAIGVATAMLDEFRASIATRRAAYTGAAVGAKPALWVRIAEAAANVDAARLLLERDLRELHAEAIGGGATPATAERARYDAAFIVELCRRAVDTLYASSGGRALFDASPLGRSFRDMHAITQHAALSLDDAGERYGKILLT